jgi:putative FmdB family regulatory protein
MPMFEYECRKCRERFERFSHRRDEEQPVPCPRCGARRTERVVSTFAAVGGRNACGPRGKFT